MRRKKFWDYLSHTDNGHLLIVAIGLMGLSALLKQLSASEATNIPMVFASICIIWALANIDC